MTDIILEARNLTKEFKGFVAVRDVNLQIRGGMGTLFGPVVGAALVVTLESDLAATSLPVPVVIGCIFVICVLVFRRGIVGELLARWPK